MVVADIMTRDVVTVTLDDTLLEIQEVLADCGFHQVVVVDRRSPRQVRGLVTDRDVLREVSPFVGRQLMERNQDLNTLRRRAHQVMRRDPVTVHESTPLPIAADLLLAREASCLPVVDDDGLLVGIVTWRDLLTECFHRCAA